MIFVTVGTQLPFDRLICALDKWAASNPEEEIFAQIGHSTHEPQHMRWARTISSNAFNSILQECSTVVAHAGMGTIISAVECGKRVVVLPRLAEFGEHRNDHQLATADRLSHLNGLVVANDVEDLTRAMNVGRDTDMQISRGSSATLTVSPELINEIRLFSGLQAA